MKSDDPIPLSHLGLDLPAPTLGWRAELDRRDITAVVDDIGRECVTPADARLLIAEHREDEARKARQRAEAERQAIEADRAFRAALAPGIPADAVPAGMTAAQLMMASDPIDQGSRRQSVLEHALAHADGAIVYHPIAGES